MGRSNHRSFQSFAVLIIGAIAFLAARRRTAAAGPEHLTADEEARINALLDEK